MLKSALSVFRFSCLLGLVACTDHKQVTVKHGEDATLQCNSLRGADVVMLKWRKPDLQSEQENRYKTLYVFYFRDGRTFENLQLPSFKDRVQLRDPQMKDGDLSVIIKNVSMNHAGVYECYAGYGTQEPQLMSNITLKVEEPGQPGGQSGDEGKKEGSTGLKVGLILAAVLFAAVVVGLVYFYRCRNTRTQYQHAAQTEEQPEMNSDSHQPAPKQEEQVGS